MIETLDDIVEQVADGLYIYGSHVDNQPRSERYCCRPCWTAHLKARILQAVEIERKLAAGL